jgi:NADPH:quinone reductase-like Zn-dependent oxidoreductase
VNQTRAILIERLGPPRVLTERTVPLRDPGRGEVHLRVLAAGVNFADLAMRVGLYGTVPPRPFSPGFEVAGEVVSAGAGVKAWREGDRALALMRHGGYAHDVVVPAANLFRVPSGLSPDHAVAVPVAFLTAWVCLFEAARARSGETVLILGAAGGVGTAAVQLARDGGLRTIGTAGSEHKRRFVREELGADACFDSRGNWEPDVRRLVGDHGIDVGLDPVGGRATASCRRLLGPLGRLVFYGLSEALPSSRRNWPRVLLALLRTPRFHPLSLVQSNVGIMGVHLLHLGRNESVLRRAFEPIVEGIESGRLRPVLDRAFPLTREGAVAAHAYIHERRNLGKVVLSTGSLDRDTSRALALPRNELYTD